MEAHSTRFLISDLITVLEEYLSSEQIKRVYNAYMFGAEAHDGQSRKSGEPYIYHPVEVVHILATLRLDSETLIAGMLHDVIEDTTTAKEQLAFEFGDDVAHMVDGVSKLKKIHFSNPAEAQAENFRKMLLAMAKDIRVIIIKLADRLHNMRTIGAMKRSSRQRIARETIEIHVPIAHRLGIRVIATELENLAFAAIYPMRNRRLCRYAMLLRIRRDAIYTAIEKRLEVKFKQQSIDAKVGFKQKNIYELYYKVKAKKGSFTELLEKICVCITVANRAECYVMVGIIHSLYRPIADKFKDNIAIPKVNGYQSIHTGVFGPDGVSLLFFIRSEAMNFVAHYGIVANWVDKANIDSCSQANQFASKWLNGLMDIQKSNDDSLQFINDIKLDLFPDDIYVITPSGDVVELPVGATPIDFAYHIHTDIGNHCVGAKINRQNVPLHTPLKNGQSVEIIRAKWGRPEPAWLNYVVTGKARTWIRNYLKNIRSDEAIIFGKHLLEESLAASDMTVININPHRIEHVLLENNLSDIEQLYKQIGLGNLTAAFIAHHLISISNELMKNSQSPLMIKGTDGMIVNIASCCRPVPGDEIIGAYSPGKGIVIHAKYCQNMAHTRKQGKYTNWLMAQWSDMVNTTFNVELMVQANDSCGVFANISRIIADSHSNITNVRVESNKDGKTKNIVFNILVKDRIHIATIIKNTRHLSDVLKIVRQPAIARSL